MTIWHSWTKLLCFMPRLAYIICQKSPPGPHIIIQHGIILGPLFWHSVTFSQKVQMNQTGQTNQEGQRQLMMKSQPTIELRDGKSHWDRPGVELQLFDYKESSVEHTWSRASTVGEQMERPQLPIYHIVQ